MKSATLPSFWVEYEKGIWSVRVTRSHRAIGVLKGETVTWF